MPARPTSTGPLDWKGCTAAATFVARGGGALAGARIENFKNAHREKCKRCREFEPAVCPADICDGSGWDVDPGCDCCNVVPCPACQPRA